jgi:ATP-dependent DNA ligase
MVQLKKMKKNRIYNLMEESPGLFLNPPHAKLIFNYAKKTIILPKLYRNSIGRTYYVVQDNECCGAINIKSAKPVSLKEFKNTQAEHRITEEEREKWWGDKKVLYAYFFDVLQKFDKPKKIKEMKDRSLGKNIKFLSEKKNPERKIELSERIKPVKSLMKSITNLDVDDKYAVEKKFKGSRVLIYKNGGNIKFFSENDKDITTDFEDFMNEADKLSDKNFVVDGVLVSKNNRSKIFLFDILRLGEDIRELSWNERKSKLHSLNFTDNISEVPSIIIKNKQEAEKAIDFLKNLPDSAGVIFKNYDSKYLQEWYEWEEI